jgi:hypothetical protein
MPRQSLANFDTSRTSISEFVRAHRSSGTWPPTRASQLSLAASGQDYLAVEQRERQSIMGSLKPH